MKSISAGKTDIGKKRKVNQDAIFLSDSIGLYLIADGMGGHNGGDIASSLATENFPENIEKCRTSKNPETYLHQSIQLTNNKIFQKAKDNPELKGMGTTMVCIEFVNDKIHIGNVGDSRCYLQSQNSLFQLTKDHSLIQEKLNLGIYNREEAQKDQMKNVLVKSVGFEENIEPDIFSFSPKLHDIFLLCSDGLHGRVSDKDISFILNRNLGEVSQLTRENLLKTTNELIQLANDNGGQDNISVILIAIL